VANGKDEGYVHTDWAEDVVCYGCVVPICRKYGAAQRGASGTHCQRDFDDITVTQDILQQIQPSIAS